jgi:hypothetical protein
MSSTALDHHVEQIVADSDEKLQIVPFLDLCFLLKDRLIIIDDIFLNNQ